MNRASIKHLLEKDDQFDDKWNTPQDLTSASNKSTNMRHVTSQPLSEQGWGRCKAGFDGVSFKEEEKDGRSYQKKRGGLKRMSLKSTVLDKEQDSSSLDIDWSSSSDSLSDIVPLPPQETSRCNSKRILPRKRTCRASTRRSNPGLHGSNVTSGRSEVFLKGDELEIADEEETEGVEGSWMMKPSSTTKQSETSQSEDKKSTQIDISDYDSPSEDQLTASSSLQQASSSLHISDQSPTPQPTPSESPTKESPKTGTELLKKLKLPSWTPDKEGATTGGPSGSGDSAKKKRKFIRGGLAEGLQRVINREKSSTAFWAHHTADTTTSQNLMLDLLVLSVEEVRGLYLTRCQICPLPTEVTEEMSVLFTQANGRQLKLNVGSRVRVHPPWQKLTLPNYKEPVILCTYFCHSLDSSEAEMPEVATNNPLYPTKTASTSSQIQLKPIQLFQPHPNQTQALSTESTLRSVLPLPTDAPNSHVSDSFLDSIAQNGAYFTAGMCVRATIHRVYCRLFNAEATTLSRILVHPGAIKHPEESTPQATQWVLLVQDKHGVFCEVQVTIGSTRDEEEEEWRQCLRQGEGKTMVFAGLKVIRRLNRTRSPGLFSLIDSLWLPCEGSISQSETESQDFRSQGLVSPQSFCYILGMQTLSNTIIEEVSDRVRIPYREPVIHTLRDVQQMSVTSNQRVTFYAKVIRAHSETSAHDVAHSSQQPGSNSVWHLFLTDSSLITESATGKENESSLVTGIDNGDGSTGTIGCSGESQGARLVHVHVRASCNLMECVEECLVIPGSLVFLRDICLYHRCHLYADTYTTIQRLAKYSTKLNEMEMLAMCNPKDDIFSRLSNAPIPPIPVFGLQSDENTLVSISGVLTGVDETTAYSWPACDTCGNNRLAADPNSACQLHCGMCKRAVTSPLTRMHLEVFLHCPSLEDKETSVKVQLLQSSIEQVLPVVSSQEEGYDLQCIMGVNIGPISCFLKTVSRQPGEPVTFELEEVYLGSMNVNQDQE